MVSLLSHALLVSKRVHTYGCAHALSFRRVLAEVQAAQAKLAAAVGALQGFTAAAADEEGNGTAGGAEGGGAAAAAAAAQAALKQEGA